MHHRITGWRVWGSRRLPCMILGMLFILSGFQPCRGDKGDDTTWSFRFEGLPIGDVLRELSDTAGVEIFTNRPPREKVLTKTYTNMTLARIIRDIFKDVSFALVWYYDEEGLDGIGVWFFDDDKGGYPGSLQSIGDRTPARRPPTPALSRRRVTAPSPREEDPWAEDDDPLDEEADSEDVAERSGWESESEAADLDEDGDDEPGETDEEGLTVPEGENGGDA